MASGIAAAYGTGPRASEPPAPLPPGGLERLVHFAGAEMAKAEAFIWGLNATATCNVRNLKTDGISTKNGEVNRAGLRHSTQHCASAPAHTRTHFPLPRTP